MCLGVSTVSKFRLFSTASGDFETLESFALFSFSGKPKKTLGSFILSLEVESNKTLIWFQVEIVKDAEMEKARILKAEEFLNFLGFDIVYLFTPLRCSNFPKMLVKI